MRLFEQWENDHLEVIRIQGDVTLIGTPIFNTIPYGRWKQIGDDTVVTLSYYPPFAHKEDTFSTHIVIRCNQDLETIEHHPDFVTLFQNQRIPYIDWITKYADISDKHLRTVTLQEQLDEV